MKILLFDIDGTLLMTGGAGRVAFERCFNEMFGIPSVWRNLRPDGKTDPIIIEELSRRALGRLLDPSEYKQLCTSYEIYFREEITRSEGFHLLPGVENLLIELNQRDDLLVGVATGNFEIPAWIKLEHGHIREHFKFGGFGSDALDRKELTRIALERGQALTTKKVESKNVFVIGDTIHDIDAGRSLNARTLAVATGRTSIQDLRTHGPDHLLENFSNAKSFLQLLESD